MARPKKTSITPEAAASIDSFRQTYLEPYPARIDLLQTLVFRLLIRIGRMDAETAQQVGVFVRVLAAKSPYWGSTMSTPQEGFNPTREMGECLDLLDEISHGKKTKKTHCAEAVRDHRRLLDLYLAQHGDFSRCRNLLTIRKWITKHEDAIIDILRPIPCFCRYGDALMPAGLPEPLKKDLEGKLTPGMFRDILLGMLHCTSRSQIAKICKDPTAFTTDRLFTRHFNDVDSFTS